MLALILSLAVIISNNSSNVFICSSVHVASTNSVAHVASSDSNIESSNCDSDTNTLDNATIQEGDEHL